MKQLRIIVNQFLTTVFILFAFNISLVWAHGEGEIPRFVSTKGTDSGHCNNRFRPCKTIHYAASQAGKGDRILLEKGRYHLLNANDILILLTGLNEVQGGYSRSDHFQTQDTTANPTYLLGVPSEYRERIAKRGFVVIADRKILPATEQKKLNVLLKSFAALQQSKVNQPCINNMAGVFACDKIDLLSHISFSSMDLEPNNGNDVWGYTDLNTGREYAFIGLDTGTAVYDITDPLTPIEVGQVTGQLTAWRDIKIYQYYNDSNQRWEAYAYVTTDGVNDRLVIMNLNDLPNGIKSTVRTGDHSAHNVYIGNVDYSFGIANNGLMPRMYITGAFSDGGAYRSFDISTPTQPQILSSGTKGYTHDASSMVITDARKDTQCAVLAASCDIVFDFNESSIEIWDVSSSGPVHLSTTTYPNSAYVHSGWWSEDKMFLFVHDEADEQRFNLNSTVRVFDLSDLKNPQLAGTWSGPTKAVDHNGFVRGNRYYISNYTHGITVLDITTPANPVEVGNFDTFPFNNNPTINGAWGVYPFLPSGNILVGDVNGGLFVLKNNTLDSPQGQFAFSSDVYHGEEGDTIIVTVERLQNSQGAVSVDIEAVPATSSANDYQLSATSLSWADGETGNKSITIDLQTDTDSESLELLILRLINPQNGATLVYPNIAKLTVADAGAASSLAFLETSIFVDQKLGKAFAIVKRLGNANGAVTVNYRTLQDTALAGTDYTAISNGILQWADGESIGKTIEIEILNSSTPNRSFSVELFNPAGATITSSDTATITITGLVTTTTPATAAPPTIHSSSGGLVDISFLCLLGVIALIRKRTLTTAQQSL